MTSGFLSKSLYCLTCPSILICSLFILLKTNLFIWPLLENVIPKLKRIYLCNHKLYLNNITNEGTEDNLIDYTQ